MLDVDGQIRIRGGEAAANKILTATGGTGLSKWILYQRLSSLSQDTVNPGVILTPNPVTDIGTVGVDSGYIQRRVTTTCPILIDLTTTQMYSIAQTGTASCRVARVSLTAGSGLLASPANPITNTGTLTIDPAYTQRRLTNVPCPAGQTIYSVAQDGAASCRSNAITISLTPGTSPSGLTFNPNPITTRRHSDLCFQYHQHYGRFWPLGVAGQSDH
ncbi:MAG: hypothetical protein HYT47_01960 [Candidatus Vogelbacteria bacterium]|nr:hypothetical protein [Candidatus Vogelbacteria bacterium]